MDYPDDCVSPSFISTTGRYELIARVNRLALKPTLILLESNRRKCKCSLQCYITTKRTELEINAKTSEIYRTTKALQINKVDCISHGQCLFFRYIESTMVLLAFAKTHSASLHGSISWTWKKVRFRRRRNGWDLSEIWFHLRPLFSRLRLQKGSRSSFQLSCRV